MVLIFMTQQIQDQPLQVEGRVQKKSMRRWLMLAVVLLATFMNALDTFIVNIAVPSIKSNIHATFAEVQFIIAGYTLGYAVVLVTGGRLGDIYGRKRLFLIGVAGFTLSSALCGFAPTPALLIFFRLLQGILAALMTPQVLALIQINFQGYERALAFSAFSITIGLASVLGQVIGGFLLATNILDLGWRSIFLVNVPIGILALLAALLLVRESHPSSALQIDIGGVATLFLALFLLVYPLIEGGNESWPLWSFVCLALSLLLLVVFALYEQQLTRRGKSPLVPLSLFRERAFLAGLLSILLSNTLFGGILLVLPFYLQDGLHYTPVQSGLVVMVMGIAFLLTSLASAGIIRRLGNRTLPLGAILILVGYLCVFLVVRFLVSLYGIVPLLLASVVVGSGNGVLMSQLLTKTLEGIDHKHVGAASGVFSTTQQIANALGVAVLGVLFASIAKGTGYINAANISFLIIGLASVGLFLTVMLFPNMSGNSHK
ncbi:MFS transporter [Ktedonobacter sp. SOSP1-52]|nr:MFS transporter [Ktedonobacter sp. SOSP1-52]